MNFQQAVVNRRLPIAEGNKKTTDKRSNDAARYRTRTQLAYLMCSGGYETGDLQIYCLWQKYDIYINIKISDTL